MVVFTLLVQVRAAYVGDPADSPFISGREEDSLFPPPELGLVRVFFLFCSISLR